MVKREKRSLKFLFLNKKSEPKRCKRKGIHGNVLWFNMAGSCVWHSYSPSSSGTGERTGKGKNVWTSQLK